MKAIFPLLLLILLATACQETSVGPELEYKNPSQTDYVIFGHFYGFCAGEECIEIYKLTQEGLFEDTNDTYPGSAKAYEANFVALDDAVFQKIKNLSFEVPPSLLEEPIIVGQPDAGDWGGIYLQVADGHFWLLDMNTTYLPEYLHPLRAQIVAAIATIHE